MKYYLIACLFKAIIIRMNEKWEGRGKGGGSSKHPPDLLDFRVAPYFPFPK